MKKIDCALLPPCKRSLEMKLRRSKYVAILWTQASSAYPMRHLSPVDYGWFLNNEQLQPNWFEGTAIPSSIFRNVEKEENTKVIEHSVHEEEASDIEISDEEPWSEDSSDDSDLY